MKNNRGFTLIEMIMVIAIVGIVFSIGYTIINKSNSSMNENKITYEGQQSIKIIDKYLTKDLEQCKNIVINGVPSNNIGEYSISLEIDDGSNPKYLVKTYKYRGKLCYQIIRQVNGGNIGLVENQIISSDENIIPFEISKSGNVYEVKICYDDNDKIKNYSFKVSSRYSEIILGEVDGAIPEIPEVDEDMEKGNGFIRFTLDKGTANALIGSSKPSSDGAYTTYTQINLNDVSNILKTKTIISTNNANGFCEAELKSGGDPEYIKTQQEDFGKMYVNQINIVVDGDITYNLKIQIKGDENSSNKGHTTTIHEYTVTQPGKYEFPMPKGKDITITGTITRNNNSTGMVVITFGTKK